MKAKVKYGSSQDKKTQFRKQKGITILVLMLFTILPKTPISSHCYPIKELSAAIFSKSFIPLDQNPA